jgi:cytochrome c biogenesis protein CcmG/thiol:disulfide interchange protein DsbE
MPQSDHLALPDGPGAASATPLAPPVSTRGRWGTRLLLLAPLIVFIGLVAAFAARLGSDASLVPSPLIGKAVPAFSLPPVKGRQLGLSSADLKGEVSLVNVFASWCVACRQEHPLFMQLKTSGTVPIHGLNYKDKPDDAAAWLNTMGDPYTRTGADLDGRVGIDWGVYGVPETFVIDAAGRIAFKQIGPISQEILDQTILPLVRKLQAERVQSQ